MGLRVEVIDTGKNCELPPSHRVPASQNGNGVAVPATATTPSNAPSSAPVDENLVPTRDLWKEAHDSLGKDKTRYLKIDENTSTSATIDDVIKTTTKKYKEWQKGALKIRGPKGIDIDVRKWSEKILNATMQSKDLITSLVSYDVTGYASGAWSNSGAMRSVSPDAIDDRIVLQIVENSSSGFELVSLLARRDEVFIPVTNEILLCCRQIEGHEAETVELFFERCNNDINIDRDSLLFFLEEHMRADMLSVIIRRRAADLPLDDEVVSMLVKHADWTSVEALFQRCMIRFLFNRRAPGVEISESVFIAAVENYRGKEVMECLLDDLAPDTPLTEKVIHSIVKNAPGGLEMMNLILDRQQPGFVVSETILEEAVSRTWETMEMFGSEQAVCIPID
ncbi:hypothetical protein AFGD_007243 [Aspergillus flavus]|nr:hypothetical protein AFGD_007243 [Aspergillus flavus]